MPIQRRTLTLALTALLTSPAFAQTTPATPPARTVQGTTQLAGDVGEIGKTFTLGKGGKAVNFTLTGAEFSVSRVTIGENVYIPKAKEKLLILHYTVHNPQKEDLHYFARTLQFTVVDAKDINHENENNVGREGTTDRLETTLKPAQKVGAYVVIAVPAAGPVPKLLVNVRDDKQVVRYDLRGKVKGLPAPFADTSDATKVTALEATPMKTGVYGPLGYFDLKLDSVALMATSIQGRELEDGERTLVAVFTVRNGAASAASARSFFARTFSFKLRDADGDVTEYDDYPLKVSRAEATSGTLRPGEEARFRVYFKLPANVKGQSLSVVENDDSHALVFDVSQAK
ncbi:DUF4352 domain-containing protein [Deinococcus yavapaiensis]|uniref:DUF4352 domain-containing protein n=1 Tax=Deinococcus yavapaiensis KR-236 TaxID=694435 RepID=A0A318S809_9DEIO|nr:DUF4352 domain-containing protein [Deinococcus yavapaiensis]PYE53166.1 hypothetical protein DES52_110150 [Deinococcus yavapaiensis KR-236]